MKTTAILTITTGIFASAMFGRADIITGPVTNAANGHVYYLLAPATWTASQAEALGLGGNLVTINDAGEDTWVYDTFASHGGQPRALWIGLTDQSAEGQFAGASGESVTYTNWSTGEPNNFEGDQDYAHIYPPSDPSGRARRWNDIEDVSSATVGGVLFQYNGVVEIAPHCLPPPSGVVAWWPMDASVKDVVGTNKPVATNGLTFISGAVGSGVSFASGGYIDIPHTAALANQQFTLEAWVRPDGPGPNNDTFGSVIIQHVVTATVNELGLWWRASDGRFLFAVGSNPASNPGDRIESTNSFPVGNFYHVTGTYDGAVFTLYVNEAVESQLSRAKPIVYSSSVPWTTGATRIPFRSGSYPRTWDGVIDEVTVYNRSLDASEVGALFAAGSSGKCRLSLVFVQQVGRQAILSWPGWAKNYGVEVTSTFTPANWLKLDKPTSVVGDRHEVVIEELESSAFYRLKSE